MNNQYREPDRKAPRFRYSTFKSINQDFFLKFKKDNPDLFFSFRDVKNILKIFHLLCLDIIANTRDGLELPEQLGYILLGKFKSADFEPIDEQTSKKYNRKVYYKNWESNEWVCKIFYSNYASKYRFKNAKLWAFQPGRPMTKKTSKAFTKNPYMYLYADHYSRISRLFRDHNRKLREIIKQQKLNSDL